MQHRRAQEGAPYDRTVTIPGRAAMITMRSRGAPPNRSSRRQEQNQPLAGPPNRNSRRRDQKPSRRRGHKPSGKGGCTP